MSTVEVIHEVSEHFDSGWRLLFQWVKYVYDDGSQPEWGYRFIWQDPEGKLRPQRGQARIPDAAVLLRLLAAASAAHWFVAAEEMRGD